MTQPVIIVGAGVVGSLLGKFLKQKKIPFVILEEKKSFELSPARTVALTKDSVSFLNSVDRVASVSLDKKDGVKFNLSKDNLDLSVNNTNSGDGKESLSVKFDHELDISFNSRYLIDVASQLDGDSIEIYLKDTGSPALIRDPADYDSIYGVMPMKG
jgi:DNA polymerase III sliding clamp (beta) subunit (PCNA family)